MAWISLFLAGVCEIGWPIGLKLGWTDAGIRPLWIGFAVVAMTVSGALLMWSQRVIPMGTPTPASGRSGSALPWSP
jgi:quaternary ammonium compound-resistance protein SugE